MISVTVLIFPLVFIIPAILCVVWSIQGLHPISVLTLENWLSALFISHLYGLEYIMFASWITWRFSQQHLVEILMLIGIGIFILLSFASEKIITQIINTQHIVTWTGIISSTILQITILTILLLLIKKLNKEQIIT